MPKRFFAMASGYPEQVSERVELDRIETDVPTRLDRLPWSRWHRLTADEPAARSGSAVE